MDSHLDYRERHSLDKSSALNPIQRALQENEDWNRDLVEHSQDLLCIHDLQGRLLSVNPSPARVLGYSVEELLRIPMRDIVSPEFRGQFDVYLNEITRTGEASGLMAVMTRSGERRIWEYQNTLRTEGVASPIVRGIAHDVTEKKRAEHLWRQASELNRQVIEGVSEGVAVFDLDQRCRVWNPFMERLHGIGSAEAIGKTHAELVAGRKGQNFSEAMERAINGEMITLPDLKSAGQNGETRWISCRKGPLRNPQGGIVGVIVTLHDVTDRKLAEEALRESEARERSKSKELETVLDAVPASVYIAYDVGCYQITANRAGYEQLRLPKGTNVSKSAPPDEQPAFRAMRDGVEVAAEDLPMQRAAATGSPVYGVPLSLLFEDGIERHTIFNAVPLLDEDGKPTGAVGASLDITEQKRAREEVRQREETQKLILDHLQVGIILSSVNEERTLYQNPKFLDLFGYSVKQFSTVEEWWKLAYPDPAYRALVAAEWYRRIAQAAKTQGEIEPMEVAITCHDRTRKYVRVLAKVIGHLNFITFIDLTESKLAEEALRSSEENYRMFVTQVSEGIFRQDLDAPIPIDLPEDEMVRRILFDSYMAECNEAMARMYGLESPQDFVGKRLAEILLADDPHNIELTREYIRSGFRVVERESHEVDMHGNRKVFLNNMIGIVKDGMLMRTWGIQRDITEKLKLEEARSHAEESLRRSDERLRIALDSSPVKLFNQDRDLRYTWVYNLQEGWTEQDYLGKTDEEIFEAEDAARMTALKRRVLESGQRAREEVTITTGGKKYHCDLTVEPLRDKAGVVVGINCACGDVTYLHEIAEELRVAKERLTEEKLYLEQTIDTELGFGEIVGQSKALQVVMGQLGKVAVSDSTVLLLGETGTGKELLARAVHNMSRRRDKSFIKLNCAAIPSGLLESELFGHEKGAFTGAVTRKIGRLELADRGTLFLDEIGEIALDLQPKLLRVLQDQEFERLGSTQTIKVNFRLVAATNRDLIRSMNERQFRSDLYYRLNVFPVRVPPLRERREDIQPLVEFFLRKYATQMNKSVGSIPKKTMEALVRWDWPGNVRELENFIERSVILTQGSVLQAPMSELETAIAAIPAAVSTERDKERKKILHVLEKVNGRLSGPSGAAARLGLSRTTLQSKLKQLGIDPERYRQ